MTVAEIGNCLHISPCYTCTDFDGLNNEHSLLSSGRADYYSGQRPSIFTCIRPNG